ncbi:MAG: hypothetical protein H7099_07090 [Gemmatimonadaceae bacterium]|nr:hypothetical protein [Gemmatimonadaceae bacterium]
MTARELIATLPLVALMATGCDTTTGPQGGEVRIAVQQALTGQTTAAGSFAISGAVADSGQTTEELTFGGPLTVSPVPVTFRRTLTGRNGTIVMIGNASLTFTSPTEATLAGSWTVSSATGAYATGDGSLSGSANFGATPPTATITYAGVLRP